MQGHGEAYPRNVYSGWATGIRFPSCRGWHYELQQFVLSSGRSGLTKSKIILAGDLWPTQFTVTACGKAVRRKVGPPNGKGCQMVRCVCVCVRVCEVPTWHLRPAQRTNS